MDKKTILTAMSQALQRQLDDTLRALDDARAGATHAEAKPENQYDTRALEQSYLAAGQSERVAELRRALNHLHFYEPPDVARGIVAGALIEVAGERGGWYFLTPFGGGMKLEVEGVPVHVVTAQAPVGAALLDKSAGDVVTLRLGGLVRELEILSVR